MRGVRREVGRGQDCYGEKNQKKITHYTLLA